MARVAALAVLLLLTVPAAARDTKGPAGPTPEKNYSHIHADVEWVTKAFRAAEDAARNENWAQAARNLQRIIDQRTSRESPSDAAPYVQPVYGTAVYEGAWIVARHMLAAWGEPALEGYAQEYGAIARELLEAAARRRDETRLTEVATRFLCLPAGRRAALLLIDLALERSDRDLALQWLEALEDLEAVSAEKPETLAPWRAARIHRHGPAVAKSGKVLPDVLTALRAVDLDSAASNLDPVPPDLRRRPPAPAVWLTTGGNAARSAVPAGLGSRFRLKWFRGPDDDDHLADTVDPSTERHDRPSIWLPPRAVATREHLFVSDGRYLHVYDLDDGKRLIDRAAARFPHQSGRDIGSDTDEDRRKHLGLLEGHTLSLHPVRDFEYVRGKERRVFGGDGYLVLAAVPDGEPWPVERLPERFGRGRDDHVQAFHWDGLRGRLEPLWRVGGRRRDGGLAPDTRLYGAPLVYRGRVWVAGVRQAKATPDRWESWILSFDPHSGEVITRTHVGTGTPVRTGRIDEVVPSSPAAACGRVVVSTALGILVAVDATDGRVQWIYRYDRAVETERGRRRNRDTRDEGQRAMSFFNEPPILALDRCYVAPTDSNKILVVFDRPRSRVRSILSSDDRTLDAMTAVALMLVEHIAGVVPGGQGRPACLVLVGKGDSSSPPGPIVAGLNALTIRPDWQAAQSGGGPGDPDWNEHSPTGFGPYPYGRALVTEDEVFVPTRHGIGVFELHDRDGDATHYLNVLNRKDMPAPDEAPATPYGNLIPVPGRGFVAVSATTVAFWQKIR